MVEKMGVTPAVRFVLVGCGNIGKKHFALLQQHDECEIAAVVDIKPQSKIEVPLQGIPYFNTLEDFFHSGIQAEVATIATPNYLHAEMAQECLRMGLHVVLEKPVALTVRGAQKIEATAREFNRQVFVVMQNRYSPVSVWMKDLVSSGILGRIYMVQVNCFWNRNSRYYEDSDWKGSLQKDGGTLFTQYSHFLDIMLWLFGDIKNIRGKFFDFRHRFETEFEDSGIVTFDFEKAGTGVLNFSTAIFDKNMESSLTVIAENGSVKISGQYMDRLEYCQVRDYEHPTLDTFVPENDYGNYKGSAGNHGYVIDNVVDVLRGHGEISVPMEDAIDLVKTINQIYAGRKQLLKEKEQFRKETVK